ncbi:MAG: hypothetical protein H7335_21920 [Massilia sp.]|nr:hypothetical protein [Massilia sp.]
MSHRSGGVRVLTNPGGLASGFAPGMPALDEFPVMVWRRMLDRAWRNTKTDILNYGDPSGEASLRAALADYLRAARGVDCDPGQVFITSGTQASLDMCAHALRIGFMVTPRALAEPLRAWLTRSAHGGRSAEQLALAQFLRGGQFALHLRRMRRLYRQRRDALVAALERHMDATGSVHGGSAGMHLAFQFHEARLSDTALSAQALENGIVAPALSAHATSARANGWNGFMLGYAQVPASQIDALVRVLATLVHAAIAGLKNHDRGHLHPVPLSCNTSLAFLGGAVSWNPRKFCRKASEPATDGYMFLRVQAVKQPINSIDAAYLPVKNAYLRPFHQRVND